MMTNRTLIFAALALLAARPVGAQPKPDLATFLLPDRAIEVTLARTAAPKEVSDLATVLVLTRTGYVEAERGTNGFTCLVVRSFDRRVGDADLWNPRVRAPHCFNPPAVRTVLPEILKRAQWVLGGTSLTEIPTRTQRAYASREFVTPAAGAMAYMLSREQHLSDAEPAWMPHLMFYYDKSMPSAVWGAGGGTAPVIDASLGDPQSPVLTLMIPVRRWSDGTLALPAAGR